MHQLPDRAVLKPKVGKKTDVCIIAAKPIRVLRRAVARWHLALTLALCPLGARRRPRTTLPSVLVSPLSRLPSRRLPESSGRCRRRAQPTRRPEAHRDMAPPAFGRKKRVLRGRAFRAHPPVTRPARGAPGARWHEWQARAKRTAEFSRRDCRLTAPPRLAASTLGRQTDQPG
jgi:hypothetical protein